MLELSSLTAPNGPDRVVEAFPRLEASLRFHIPASNLCTLVLAFLGPCLLAADSHAQDVAGCPSTSSNNVCLTTYQGGTSRLGYDPSEPTLTQTAITTKTGTKFHKQFSVPVNGAVYAQPLVLPNVTIGTTTYADVAYVATEENWVYAIDAATGNILWSKNLSPSGYTYLQAADVNGCVNILPSPGNIGVTGTPVIDISANQGTTSITSGVLYVVAKLKTTTTPVNYKQTLFALSIINGGNGVSATTPYATTDIGGTFNKIVFNQGPVVGSTSPYSKTQNQRGALLALPVAGQNPQIIITWGAHCDHQNFPYNGWMMAYQLNSSQNALTQTAIWAVIPAKHSYEGGIWQGASGPALDANGNIFLSTGNGDSSVKVSTPPADNPAACSTTPCDYGNSILEFQLSGNSFNVLDFFTTFDWKNRNTNDYDLGSGGLMILPNQPGGDPENLLVQAGKEGTIYLAQTSPVGTLGGYTGNGVSDATIQSLHNILCYNTADECGVWGSPAWWNTTSGGNGSTGYAYFGGKNLPLMQFQFYPNGNTCTGGVEAGFCTQPTAKTKHTFGWPGPTPTVSATSSTATQAIVWIIDAHRALASGPSALWAFDATTLSCLYTTDQTVNSSSCTRKAPSTDVPSGIAVKFSVPSVANGKLFVGTAGASSTTGGFLNIYGIN